MTRDEFETSVGRRIAPKEDFVAAVGRGCAGRGGFAAGKLGGTERAWLSYPAVLAREDDALRRRAYELALSRRSLAHAGIFPADPGFQRDWSSFFAREVAQLDAVGLLPDAYREHQQNIAFHGLANDMLTLAKDQQPDRSSPHEESRCYLPAFEGADLLLVCPFAEVLRERANAATFEAVWAKTGKPWFHPRSVQALEFPYGFARATHRSYATSFDLLAELREEISRRDFDVALIAAGGMGIPLAAFARSSGRVAISLGGHLQIVFGVLGARWRQKESWQRRYFNESWIDLPDRYGADPAETGENYW